VCRFTGLAGYERKIASRMMNYHLGRLVQQLYDRPQKQPLSHVIEYNPVVVTEKVAE
jgi:hypothetical protein